MNKQVKAVKDHNAWHVKKKFFEESLTEYRNNHNGEKDDCIIIFFDKRTGNFKYKSEDAEGIGLKPMEAVGALEIVKSSIFQSCYIDD